MKSLLYITVVLLFVLGGCDYGSEQQRRVATTSRVEAFDRAERQIPQPIPTNFLARKMLAKYTIRQDTPDRPFYIYVLGDTGNIVGYYVAQAAPVSVNAFLSSTQEYGDKGVTLPSLDGIFYGGAGASAGSDAWFFFDAATDALIIIYGMKLFVTDQPLKIDAKPIQIQQK